MPAGTTFLVERYIPRLRAADVDLLGRRLAAATAELRAEGREVCWLRSYALSDDETCLCVFVAGARADVEEANRRAESAYERILETYTIERDEKLTR
jgi:Nickel responsive protein SCO4226-like